MPFRNATSLRVFAAVAALITCVWYTMDVNPEVQFGLSVLEAKLKWAERLRGAPKYVIVGGSNTLFGIEPSRLVEVHEIPAVNMGITANFGPEFMTRLGVEVAEPGDTLVMSMEPHLLVGTLQHPAIAVQIAYAHGRPDFLDGVGTAVERNRVREILALRPMGQHTFSMLTKAITGRPLFRYQKSDIHSDGFVTTSVRGASFLGFRPFLPSDEFLDFLTVVRDRSKARNIELIYFNPWVCVSPEDQAAWRRSTAQALARIANIVPVLRDESLGVISDVSLFSDSYLHLTAEGAVERTDQLGDLLKNRKFWTVRELGDFGEGN